MKKLKLLLVILMIFTLTGCLPSDKDKNTGLSQQQLWEELKLDSESYWSSGEYYLSFSASEDGKFFYAQVREVPDLDSSSGIVAGETSDFRYAGDGNYTFKAVFPGGIRDVELHYSTEGAKRIRVLTYLDGGGTQSQTYKPVNVRKTDPVNPPTPVDPDNPDNPDNPPVDPVNPDNPDNPPVPAEDTGLTVLELWKILSAADSWTNSDNEFVQFHTNGVIHQYYEGTWDAGNEMGIAEVVDFRYEGENVYVATCRWLVDNIDEEKVDEITGEIRITCDPEKTDSIKVLCYEAESEQVYARDENSQLDQNTVWELLAGKWTYQNYIYEFVKDAETGEMYVNYTANGQFYRTKVTDFHGQHYEYTFAMIIPNEEEDVIYPTIILHPKDMAYIQIDDRDYKKSK